MDGQVDRMTPVGQSQHESRPRDGTADIYPASQSQTSYNQYSQLQHPMKIGRRNGRGVLIGNRGLTEIHPRGTLDMRV
jgi:hypothetical protein